MFGRVLAITLIMTGASGCLTSHDKFVLPFTGKPLKKIMTHRVRENLLLIGTVVLLVYLIVSPILDRWGIDISLPQVQEPTVSAARVIKVWAYKNTGWYYCPDSQYYGRFKPGMYLTQEQALERGYQPAAQEPCK
jgi:hypothetical protein